MTSLETKHMPLSDAVKIIEDCRGRYFGNAEIPAATSFVSPARRATVGRQVEGTRTSATTPDLAAGRADCLVPSA
ncbi:unnamed protein product [Macrosiphum euphorbiae]|uniref:Uncharacterized protein n=1 Tax=Macrosiphum euphorbiae TaxID=13131 RepID=A0AAV0Y8Z3_9HEMI|nr:unnamed protein product [Macrosiphum euphorbiae]